MNDNKLEKLEKENFELASHNLRLLRRVGENVMETVKEYQKLMASYDKTINAYYNYPREDLDEWDQESLARVFKEDMLDCEYDFYDALKAFRDLTCCIIEATCYKTLKYLGKENAQ